MMQCFPISKHLVTVGRKNSHLTSDLKWKMKDKKGGCKEEHSEAMNTKED